MSVNESANGRISTRELDGYDSKKLACIGRYRCTLSLAKFLQSGDHHGIAVPSCTWLRIPTCRAVKRCYTVLIAQLPSTASVTDSISLGPRPKPTPARIASNIMRGERGSGQVAT